MLTAAPASTATPQPSLRPWELVPAFDHLPEGLKWSGATPPPPLHSRVNVTMNSFGPGQVVGFFYADGFAGVGVRPDELPAWFAKQNPGQQVIHVFGREICPE